MTPLYGIDTSVLMRLLTGQPQDLYEYCRNQLLTLAREDAEVVASNQVIGEAYIALQHSHGVSKDDACTALFSVLSSGFVAPQNGQAVLDALQVRSGAGLVDRLIADHYSRSELDTLTLDRRMAALPGVRRL